MFAYQIFHTKTYSCLLGRYTAWLLYQDQNRAKENPTITWNTYHILTDITRPLQDQQQGAYFIILLPSEDVNRMISH